MKKLFPLFIISLVICQGSREEPNRLTFEKIDYFSDIMGWTKTLHGWKNLKNKILKWDDVKNEELGTSGLLNISGLELFNVNQYPNIKILVIHFFDGRYRFTDRSNLLYEKVSIIIFDSDRIETNFYFDKWGDDIKTFSVPVYQRPFNRNISDKYHGDLILKTTTTTMSIFSEEDIVDDYYTLNTSIEMYLNQYLKEKENEDFLSYKYKSENKGFTNFIITYFVHKDKIQFLLSNYSDIKDNTYFTYGTSLNNQFNYIDPSVRFKTHYFESDYHDFRNFFGQLFTKTLTD